MADAVKTWARLAAIACQSPIFQAFAAARCGVPTGQLSNTAAAQFLRSECGIASRRDLDTNPDALARFRALMTDYDAWRGRIADPRQASQPRKDPANDT